MFGPRNYELLRNVISLPEQVSGPSQPGSPAGPTTARSGPARARASRSARQDAASVPTIHGICGPTSFASSVPAGPLSSWESRLRDRLATVGSTECALIWREKVSPAGQSISRLAPWTPRTSASGSGGAPWPTPEAGAFGAADPQKIIDRRAALATKYGNNGFGLTLGQAVALSQWPTASAKDWRSDRSQQTSAELYGTKGRPLSRTILEASGEIQTGSSATTAKRGAPNPEFAFWLMGWPDEFRRGVLRAIASLPSSRRRSSVPSSTSKTTD